MGGKPSISQSARSHCGSGSPMDPTLDAAQRYLSPALKVIEDAAVNDGRENEVIFGLVCLKAWLNAAMKFVKECDVADEVVVAFYEATGKARIAAHNIQHHGSNVVIQLEKLCSVIGAMDSDNPRSKALAFEELDKRVKPEMMNLPESIHVDLEEAQKAYKNVHDLATRVIKKPTKGNARYNVVVLLLCTVVAVVILGAICGYFFAPVVTTATVKTAVAAVAAKVKAVLAVVLTSENAITVARSALTIKLGKAIVINWPATSVAVAVPGEKRKEKRTEWMREAQKISAGKISELIVLQNEVKVAQSKLRVVSSTTGDVQRMEYPEGLKNENFKDRLHEALDVMRKLDKACTDLIDGVNDAYKDWITKGKARVLEKILEGV